MAGKSIDRAYLEVDGTRIICDSIDIDPEDDTDFVTGMTTDNEPLGIRSGNRRYDVRAEVTMNDDEDVDFHLLWQDKDNIPVSVEFEGGVTWAWSNGVISKPGLGARHGEKVTWSLELKCWGLQVS